MSYPWCISLFTRYPAVVSKLLLVLLSQCLLWPLLPRLFPRKANKTNKTKTQRKGLSCRSPVFSLSLRSTSRFLSLRSPHWTIDLPFLAVCKRMNCRPSAFERVCASSYTISPRHEVKPSEAVNSMNCRNTNPKQKRHKSPVKLQKSSEVAEIHVALESQYAEVC